MIHKSNKRESAYSETRQSNDEIRNKPNVKNLLLTNQNRAFS